ncbi:siderophore-interacting protein [Mariniluteicoccus flavus]
MTNAKPERPARRGTVVAAGDLCPGMRRLVLHVPDLDPDLPHSDHYVKLVFGDCTRTYTIRAWDAATHEMTLDFVVHGDEGLAGPWARDAEPGATIELRGPGGKWAPEPGLSHLLLVGDESAIPAIARALELVDPTTSAAVFLEVDDAEHRVPLPATHADVTWVHRRDHGLTAAPGMALAHAAQAYADFPDDWQRFGAFVHGNADMIKDVRRWLFVDHGVPKERVSISGYWRYGLSDEAWRATKKEFNAQMEAEEARR